MRRIGDIDLLEDYVIRGEITWWSVAILVVGALACTLAAVAFPHEPVGILWFALLALVSVLALPVHELVHALAFLLASGFRAHVRFGFDQGMLYTHAPGTILKRPLFYFVLLAPSVLVTAFVWAVPALLGWPLLGLACAFVHLAGCTGDMALARAISFEPRANLIEDTPRGVSLLCDG